jgi:hypothetical protein
MAKSKHETESGRIFAKETKGVGRSLADLPKEGHVGKRQAQRRAKEQREHDEMASDYYCTGEFDGPLCAYKVCKTSLSRVAADLLKLFEPTEGNGDSFRGDIVVWHDKKVVAIVGLGSDGKPVATTF